MLSFVNFRFRAHEVLGSSYMGCMPCYGSWTPQACIFPTSIGPSTVPYPIKVYSPESYPESYAAMLSQCLHTKKNLSMGCLDPLRNGPCSDDSPLMQLSSLQLFPSFQFERALYHPHRTQPLHNGLQISPNQCLFMLYAREG